MQKDFLKIELMKLLPSDFAPNINIRTEIQM